MALDKMQCFNNSCVLWPVCVFMMCRTFNCFVADALWTDINLQTVVHVALGLYRYSVTKPFSQSALQNCTFFWLPREISGTEKMLLAPLTLPDSHVQVVKLHMQASSLIIAERFSWRPFSLWHGMQKMPPPHFPSGPGPNLFLHHLFIKGQKCSSDIEFDSGRCMAECDSWFLPFNSLLMYVWKGTRQL